MEIKKTAMAGTLESSDAQVTVEPPIYLAEGTVVMNGALVALEDNSVLRKFQVTLLPRDCMFGFIITDLTFSD